MGNYKQILNLESKAEMTFDNGQFDEHLNLWDKSEFKFESPFGSFEDSAAYIKWLKEFYQMTQKVGGTRHMVLNPVVHIAETTAHFTGYLYVINKSDGSFMGTSLMKDAFRLVDGQWKFVYRSVAPDQDLSALFN